MPGGKLPGGTLPGGMLSGSRVAEVERVADRFRGALLGVAIGDALGAPLEGGSMRDRASLAAWVSEPPHALRYTDDTHMTLATAGSLIECRGFDAEHMAQAMAAQYEREPWRGYGVGPPHVFGEMRHGRSWEDAAHELFGGTGSFGNGAAMRVAPIGLFHCREPKRAAEVARAAAQITHAHPVGQDGAGIIAAAVAELVSFPRDEPVEPGRFIARVRAHTRTRRFRDLLDAAVSLGPADKHTVVKVLGNGIEAHRSVATAVYAFVRHSGSFQDAVLFALSLGGDADTIASMTGALAGAARGASSIPAPWAERVEGREQLLMQAKGLLELALGDRV